MEPITPIVTLNSQTQTSIANPSTPKALNIQQTSGDIKIPWSKKSMYIASLVFGIGGSFLIVWQNLKRINKPEKAREFFIWGGIIALIITFIIINFHIKYGYLSGFLLIVWFDRFYLTMWTKENPNIKPRFGWTMVGWGFLGTVATITSLVLILLFLR